MNITDFIFNAIYKGALLIGASERASKDQAVLGVEAWRKGKFKKPILLIEERIKEAKKWKAK